VAARKLVAAKAPPLPKAAKPAEFKMVPAGPLEIGKGQRWEALIREEGEAVSDVFPVVLVYAFSGNAAANLIDMMRTAVRAELDSRARAAKEKVIKRGKSGVR
jgi:hypothetical protein